MTRKMIKINEIILKEVFSKDFLTFIQLFQQVGFYKNSIMNLDLVRSKLEVNITLRNKITQGDQEKTLESIEIPRQRWYSTNHSL